MNVSTPPKSPLLLTFVQLALLLFFIYATFVGGQTAQGIFDHRWRLITLWLAALLVGSWLLWRLSRPQQLPRTPLDGPLLFLLIAWLAATCFSLNPVYSREAFVFFIGYLFFFYMAADLGRWPWLVELTFNAILGVAGLVWMLALLQLSWWYQDQMALGLPLVGPPRLSVLGNPNTMAGYIALVLPLLLYKIVISRSWLARLLLVGWVLMLSGAILLTGSRGGVAGAIVAVVAFGLVIFWRNQTLAIEKKPGRLASGLLQRKRWLMILAGAGVLALLAGLLLFSRGLVSGVGVRQQVMSGALKTIAAHPLSGAGPGALGEALIRYQQPLPTLWSDAHNLILTMVAETGLIGGLALVWLGWAGLNVGRTTWQQARSEWKLASQTCAAALLGFLVHNQVDSMFKFPLMMLHVAILAGFWLSPYLVSTPLSSPRARLIILLAGAILIVTVWLGLNSLTHIRAYNEAVAAANQGDWPQALARLEAANRLAPAMPFYQRQQGLVAGYLAASDPAYRSPAIAAYEAALSRVDQLPLDQANLACLYWEDEQPEPALRHMRRAVDLDPVEPLYHLNLGLYLEQTGQFEAAWIEYSQVLRLQPAALQAGFWQQTEARAAALPAIIARVEETVQAAPPDWLSLARLHFFATDYAAAIQIYDQLLEQGPDSAELHLERGRVLLAEGRMVEAEAEFQRAKIRNPRLAGPYLAVSQMALAVGDLATAQHNSHLALLLAETEETLFQAGRVAEARADEAAALAAYEAAFSQATRPATDVEASRYATEIARRRPLPLSRLPCLRQLYPTPLLIEISQAQIRLQPSRAAEIEARLQGYESDFPFLQIQP